MSRRRITILFAALAVMFVSLYLSFLIVYPRWELSRLGDLKLPWRIRILSWEDLDIGIHTTLQLKPDEVTQFIDDNGLKLATGPAVRTKGNFAIRKCVHEGRNSADIELNPTTAVVRIWIGTPDHSGDLPCNP